MDRPPLALRDIADRMIDRRVWFHGAVVSFLNRDGMPRGLTLQITEVRLFGRSWRVIRWRGRGRRMSCAGVQARGYRLDSEVLAADAIAAEADNDNGETPPARTAR